MAVRFYLWVGLFLSSAGVLHKANATSTAEISQRNFVEDRNISLEQLEEHRQRRGLKDKFKNFMHGAKDKMKKFFGNLGDFIKSHNEAFKKGLKSFAVGTLDKLHIDLGDMIRLRNRFRRKNRNHSDGQLYVGGQGIRTRRDVPSEFSYRDTCVTKVEDQTAAVEGQICKRFGKMLRISEQQIIDCSDTPEYGNGGCEGGDPTMAWHYMGDNGISTEKAYPRSDNKKHGCLYHPEQSIPYTVRQTTSGNASYGYFNPNDIDSMMEVLRTVGPLTASMCGDTAGFNLYKAGVYKESDCPSDDNSTNHNVAIIGYGRDKATGMDYWLVKNSWGADWGERGFGRIVRGINQCGIESDVTFPIVDGIGAAASLSERVAGKTKKWLQSKKIM